MEEALQEIDINQSEQDIQEQNLYEKDQSEEQDHGEGQDQELATEQGEFKDGQVLRMVRVRFPGHNRSLPFFIGNRVIPYGKTVMAMSDRGLAVGYINSFPYEVKCTPNLLPIKSINKLATQSDLVKEKEQWRREQNSRQLCRDLALKHNLDMEVTHVEYIQFGKKAVFYFTAPSRVDFRLLVKDLVDVLKIRIELRQISWRDRSAALGGLGPCGQQLCCSSFLNKYGHVNIKFAKNQNLSFGQNKLNGVCGQLKCCLKYEDDVYTHKREHLPDEGSYLLAMNGDFGRVERLHILSEQFEMLTAEGVLRRYDKNQYSQDGKNPKDKSFPQSFSHIIDERKTLIV